MIVSRWVAPVASVVILFGTIGVAQATGGWVTTGRTGPGVNTTAATQSITGRMTLRQVADANHVDLAKLIVACGLPADVDVDALLKDLVESDRYPGFEVQTVRDAVASLK
ncbi:MAG: hypothetical protein HZY73_01870 [Micropruina sp.]|nr:MAG: hypothetical protein HZY73_01870 [Micropruina sp.]